jgi:hypothetical protein
VWTIDSGAVAPAKLSTGAPYWDSSGNVGIGTNSPTNKLNVSDTAIWPARFESSNSVATAIEIRNTNTRAWECAVAASGAIGPMPGGSYYLYDQTAALVRFGVDTSGNTYINSGYGSAAVAYGCRAWVNFNGKNTVSVRASGNVSSIGDNGTGDYTVNFSNAMPDTNYIMHGLTSGSASNSGGTGALAIVSYAISGGTYVSKGTSSVRIYTGDNNGDSLGDYTAVDVTFFR